MASFKLRSGEITEGAGGGGGHLALVVSRTLHVPARREGMEFNSSLYQVNLKTESVMWTILFAMKYGMCRGCNMDATCV